MDKSTVDKILQDLYVQLSPQGNAADGRSSQSSSDEAMPSVPLQRQSQMGEELTIHGDLDNTVRISASQGDRMETDEPVTQPSSGGPGPLLIAGTSLTCTSQAELKEMSVKVGDEVLLMECIKEKSLQRRRLAANLPKPHLCNSAAGVRNPSDAASLDMHLMTHDPASQPGSSTAAGPFHITGTSLICKSLQAELDEMSAKLEDKASRAACTEEERLEQSQLAANLPELHLGNSAAGLRNSSASLDMHPKTHDAASHPGLSTGGGPFLIEGTTLICNSQGELDEMIPKFVEEALHTEHMEQESLQLRALATNLPRLQGKSAPGI